MCIRDSPPVNREGGYTVYNTLPSPNSSWMQCELYLSTSSLYAGDRAAAPVGWQRLPSNSSCRRKMVNQALQLTSIRRYQSLRFGAQSKTLARSMLFWANPSPIQNVSTFNGVGTSFPPLPIRHILLTTVSSQGGLGAYIFIDH